ncbi:UBX domain-containing protein 4-like isoform X2 [Megalops cyprinoides]|uniref:UBX domain-containing protein 4-like isoform X2 n=1 Tax=Megalops cyprinoides TaxID=118141 RepID=UPI0018655A0A|nr:UBX domain-containing protein 4-like isoform X2 [Megalops cyprinoides]
MLWFEGSIPAAIVSAKQQNSVFVVVITGDDEQSTQMLSSWEDGRVAEATDHCFVAIKIDAKSETCVQFSQIYPVVCIPSSFFIGENGIPLEVIAGSVSAEELVKRINKVKQMHTQEVEVEVRVGDQPSVHPEAPPEVLPVPDVTPDQNARQPSPAENDESGHTLPPSTANESTAPPATSKESLSRPAEEGGASGYVTPAEDRSLSSDDVSLSSQSEEALDAKVERLTKKLEERRERRKKGEEENEIKKEMERRRLGKEMLDYKRKQEGERTKRMLEERNREKAEERAARERVKQQIALDRADRAARYAKNKEEVEAAKAAALQARQAELEAKKEALQRERSAIARIQFRLPDGSSFTNQFPSETRLQEARQFAAQEVGNRYGHFSLATMFPRREFTGEDLDKTLLELELAPSASIVLLPTGRPANTVVQSSGGGIWAVLGTIFYPLLAVWRFISSFLFCSPPPPGPSHRAPPQRPSPAATSSSEPNRESIRKRVLEKRPEDFKKDGKIYRLKTQEDSEDDNNTWNGNSTQQM